jgi:hypothetical protein
MKFLTKLKIVNWVEKLLNLDYPKTPLIYKEEQKIERVRHQHIYNNQELNMISEHQVRFAAGLAIVEMLNCEDMGPSFITYTRERVDIDHTKVVAELNVIMK